MSSRFALVAMTVSAAALAAGCNSNNSNNAQQPGQSGQQQSGPAWTLTLKSACADAAQDQCLAKYGFSVNADGKFQVGPGPQGQVRTGMLTDAEFAAVKTQLTPVMGTHAAAEDQESGVENVSDDSITLTRPNTAAQVVAHNQADHLFFTTGSAESAKSLHAAIRDLANSYYHLPFGDACGDAADKITDAAAKLQNCQTDSDCVYIDAYDSFAVVPPSSVQWLQVEDCTAVQAPVVANKLSILGGAQTLNDLYAAARNTCGNEFYQGNLGVRCYALQKSTQAQPACVQNRCQSRL